MLFDRIADAAFPPLDMMTFFSLAALAASAAVLLAILWKRPHWFVRPSLLIFTFFFLRVQLPSILYLSKASETVVKAWHYPLMIHGFALAFLAAAIPIYMMFDGRSREIWQRMRTQIREKVNLPGMFTAIMLALTCVTMAAYFSLISFRDTGLYYLIFDPLGLNAARQESLKNLSNQYVIYLYFWNYTIFVPLVLVAATIAVVQYKRYYYIPLAVLAVFSTLLSANRGNIALAILVVLIAFALIQLDKMRPLRMLILLVAGGFLVLFGPAMISILREGKEPTIAEISDRVTNSVAGRAFLAPAHSGLIYVYHAQITEYRGIAGIRPITILFGMQYNEITEEIGALYVSGGGAGTVCNTSFLASYYILFGLYAIPICIVGVLLFDVFLLIFHLPDLTILPFFILFILKSLDLSETTITRALLTSGYLLVPLCAVLAALLQPLSDKRTNEKHIVRRNK